MSSYNAVDYGSYTVTGTAGSFLSFADAGSPSSLPSVAKAFVGVLETAQVRVRHDGTDPTTSEGVLLDVGDVIYMTESDIGGSDWIRTGSTSGVIKGHFYSATVPQLLGSR
jgi:hypothetical protein